MNYSLFSTITTLYILALLYFPPRFIFSPVVFSTLVLLLYLLRFGAAQSGLGSGQDAKEFIDRGPDPIAESFVEWNVRAPLEVIYEEFEGEEDATTNDIQRYSSLSLFYPESGSSEEDYSSSDGDWEDDMRFRWEENLIEIALDEKKCNEVEEDNLIEIDLSPSIHL